MRSPLNVRNVRKVKHVCCISFLFFTALLLIFLGFSQTKGRLFECSLKISCAPDENEVLHLSSIENAHGELANLSNYPYKLCCRLSDKKNDFAVEVSPPSCAEGKFISLSSQTNAHAGIYGLYPWNICLETLDESQGIIICEMRNSCRDFETCALGLSSEENAHLGACENYPIKICCSYAAKVPVRIKLRLIDDFGNPAKGKEVDAYLCYAEEKYCDEGARYLAKASNVSDENGYTALTLYAILYPGKKYKVSVVTENGYAETEEFTLE